MYELACLDSPNFDKISNENHLVEYKVISRADFFYFLMKIYKIVVLEIKKCLIG